MKHYTYNYRWHAYRCYRSGYSDQVIVPDQVADNQQDYNGKAFPALTLSGKRATVTLIGDDYDLTGSGTGDLRVRAGRVIQ